MKTLLVLAEHPDFAEAIRAALDPEQYRMIHRRTVEEAEPLLVHGLAEACIIDVELTSVQGVWLLEKLRRRAPKCPVVVFTGARAWEWEEEAYLQGVSHVLVKPVRPRILGTVLARLWNKDTAGPLPSAQTPLPLPAPTLLESGVPSAPAPTHSLGILRGFSGILTHSLDAEGMLREFLLFLREILNINRAAIFLRQPFAPFETSAPPEGGRRLRVASAVGLSPGLLQHFELSFDAGIGAHIFRLGRILRRYGDEARTDLETQKEFDLLGAQVAVPVLDRETVIGVAVFDGHITGESLANSELQLVFHLLEQLGLAIKNIWLHGQLAGNHEMMADILRELSSGCVVVSRDLGILHANKMARRYFGRGERRTGEMEFSDLPQAIGAKVYQVLKTGSAISNFRYEPEDGTGRVFNLNIIPFQRQTADLPASALLMVEDLTQTQQLQRLELEAASLRLVKNMAERLTNEIGNALVPLSVHQQVLEEKLGTRKVDSEFLKMMERDLAESVRRVTRLCNQMRFLARDSLLAQEVFPLAPLLEEAFQDARRHQAVKAAELQCESVSQPFIVKGDRAALKQALSEVLLNALQANPAQAKVDVRFQTQSNGNGLPALQIDVRDQGAGFTPEAAQKAATPFFTTRVVGLGLGLAVSRKIIENHHGKLEVITPTNGQTGLVRISLPLESAASGA